MSGLTITSEHYDTAIDILKTRFGRKEKIIYHHILELLNLQIGPKTNVAALWKLQDTLLIHVRSLEALDITGNQYGVILTPLILSRLPHELRMEWAREGESHEADLDYLLTFLQKEIQRRERSNTYTKSTASEEKRSPSTSQGLTPTAAALQTSAKPAAAASAAPPPPKKQH